MADHSSIADIEDQLRKAGFATMPAGTYERALASAWRNSQYDAQQKHKDQYSTMPASPDDCKFTHMEEWACSKCSASRSTLDDDGESWLRCDHHTMLSPIPPHELTKALAPTVDDESCSGQVRLNKATYIAFVRRAARRYGDYRRFVAYAVRESLGLQVNLPADRFKVRQEVTDKTLKELLEMAKKRQSVKVNLNLTAVEREGLKTRAVAESLSLNAFVVRKLKYSTLTPTFAPSEWNEHEKGQSVEAPQNGGSDHKNGVHTEALK